MKTMTNRYDSQDAIVTERLKKLERISVPVFFAIPLCLWLAGGKTLALWTLFIWPIFCAAYLIAFHRFHRGYSMPQLRKLALLSNRHVFYQMSWLILILLLGFFIVLLIQNAS